jgi:hypothetical protein
MLTHGNEVKRMELPEDEPGMELVSSVLHLPLLFSLLLSLLLTLYLSLPLLSPPVQKSQQFMLAK